jgi:hypothetical protein
MLLTLHYSSMRVKLKKWGHDSAHIELIMTSWMPSTGVEQACMIRLRQADYVSLYYVTNLLSTKLVLQTFPYSFFKFCRTLGNCTVPAMVIRFLCNEVDFPGNLFRVDLVS